MGQYCGVKQAFSFVGRVSRDHGKPNTQIGLSLFERTPQVAQPHFVPANAEAWIGGSGAAVSGAVWVLQRPKSTGLSRCFACGLACCELAH